MLGADQLASFKRDQAVGNSHRTDRQQREGSPPTPTGQPPPPSHPGAATGIAAAPNHPSSAPLATITVLSLIFLRITGTEYSGVHDQLDSVLSLLLFVLHIFVPMCTAMFVCYRRHHPCKLLQ